MSRGTIRRIAIALMVGGVLLVTYPAVSGGVLWDLGAACGYICLILFVCLYAFPVRGDGLPHARLLGLSQHKSLGWCVLGAAIAHVVILLLAEPLSTRYLLPSAPLFMWCGIAALLMLVALVITGLSARAQMRRSPAARVAGASRDAEAAMPRAAEAAAAGAARAAGSRNGEAATSRATLHVVLASLTMATACAHIVGSSQLLSGAFKPVFVLLLVSLPLIWYALRPRLRRWQPTRHNAVGTNSRSARNGASDARRRSLAWPVSHLAAVALVALMPAPMSKQLLLEPMVRPSPIAVSFPHDSHTSVNCVTCHHNYVDHTGTAACIECHRNANTGAARADLAQPGRPRQQLGGLGTPFRSSSESTFHTFCRDCHTQLALDSNWFGVRNAKHGPTRSCSACHQGMRSNNL